MPASQAAQPFFEENTRIQGGGNARDWAPAKRSHVGHGRIRFLDQTERTARVIAAIKKGSVNVDLAPASQAGHAVEAIAGNEIGLGACQRSAFQGRCCA